MPAQCDLTVDVHRAAGFIVSYCAPEALKVGCCSSIRFRIESSPDTAEHMDIILRNGQKEIARGECDGAARECRLNVTPSVAGNLYLDVEIIVRHFGAAEDEVYATEFHVTVDDKSVGPIVYSPNVHVDRIGAGWKGDFQIGMPPSTGASTDARRYDCNYASPTSLTAVLRRSPHRLSLMSESCEILVLSDEAVQFGRDVGVRVPVFDERTGKYDEPLTMHVSGRHFRVELVNGRCVIGDGGDGKPSTNGTVVDGRFLSPGGTRSLATGTDHRVAVMRSHNPDDVLVPFSLHVGGDSWIPKPSGCFVVREDGVRTRVLLAWSAVGVALSKGTSIGWSGTNFCMRCGGSTHPLAIGDVVNVGGVDYRVMPFHQRSPRKTISEQNTERNDR